MKNLAVIKSARSLNNKVSFYGGVHVEVQEWLKGHTNLIVVWFDHNMLFMSGIDTVQEITDQLEAKYDNYCVCTSIQTRPYLASDNETWLHRPVIEVMLRIKEK